MAQKLALGIEYDGSMYCGWQRQKCSPSVQSCIESALNKITSEPMQVFCAGRTDSGVHALEQVIHFKTNVQRSQSAWVSGTNSYLPSNICVRWVSVVHDDFHARFSAISRRYYYLIYNSYVRSSFFLRKAWHYKKCLDIFKMSKAAQCLLGEHDFTAFRASGCQSYSSYRKLFHLNITQMGRCIVIDIEANAFVYHMVRNIVGSLVEVGCGDRSETWISELLRNCNRSLSGVTAPASGLYLAKIKYPKYLFIPF